jgi:hypothetical protein
VKNERLETKKVGCAEAHIQEPKENVSFGVHKVFPNENPTKEILETENSFEKIRKAKKRHTPFDCEYLIFDSKGYPCCIENLESPAYCCPENCPFVREILNDK